MTPRNCLSYALDRWHADGGYLAARRSAHWGMPHVLHIDCEGQITHYKPPSRLKKPAISLTGYHGEVVTGDQDPALPVPLTGIVLASWIAAFGATWWALTVWLRRACK